MCKLWPRSALCDPISCPILTTTSVAVISRYRDTRYWYPILTPISGQHVTDIGTPDIDPDTNPDIGYVVYDIGAMMTRYRVCTRYRYRYRVTYDMSRYRVKGKTRYRDTQPDIVSLGDPISGKNPISGMARFQMAARGPTAAVSDRRTVRSPSP